MPLDGCRSRGKGGQAVLFALPGTAVPSGTAVPESCWLFSSAFPLLSRVSSPALRGQRLGGFLPYSRPTDSAAARPGGTGEAVQSMKSPRPKPGAKFQTLESRYTAAASMS